MPKKRSRQGRSWLPPALMLLLMAALGVTYALHVPFGQAPDESAHWQYVRHLATTHDLPVFRPGQGGYEFHQPPLFYALALLGGGHYLGARMVNLALGLSVVLLTSLLALEYTGGRRNVALAAAGIAAFLPMQVFLSATVNNDVLLTAAFGGALWLGVRMLARGPSLRLAAGLGLFAGIGLLAKTSAVLLLPVGVLGILLARAKGDPVGRVLGQMALFLGVTLALGGWWLVRNAVLYGDPLTLSAFSAAFTKAPTPDYFLSRGVTPFWYGVLVAGWTIASFWGVFGNMNVFLPWPAYLALSGIPVGAIAGQARPAVAPQPWQRRACLLLGATAVLLLAAYVRFNLEYFQAQARYLLPALPAFALAFAAGWERLLPARARSWGIAAPAAVLCVVSWWAIQFLPGGR